MPLRRPHALDAGDARLRCAARLGEALPSDAFAGVALPPHLRINVRVVDAAGEELAQGRDLRRCARSSAKRRS